MNEIFEKLYADFGEESIQRTNAAQTGKGYDTTGYGYQWIVDRFNEVCGSDWGFNWEEISHVEGKYKSGYPYHEVVVRLSIWIINKDNARECVGGHTSFNFGDALKGAITNAFKKTAAFWGVGSKAFRGEIDPDNSPMPDKDTNKEITKINYKIDFDEIKEKLEDMNYDQMKNYYEEIIVNAKTEKQKIAISNIFKIVKEKKQGNRTSHWDDLDNQPVLEEIYK